MTARRVQQGRPLGDRRYPRRPIPKPNPWGDWVVLPRVLAVDSQFVLVSS